MDTNPASDTLDDIEDDLHRLYPDLEVSGLPITGRILRLARYLEARREEVLGEFELTVADFDVLATMRRRAGTESINVRDLQRSMMLSSGGTTKRLDRLENSGLIARHPDPHDRRGVVISLTAEGLQLIDEAIPAMTRFENGLVTGAVASARLRTQLANGLHQMLLSQEASDAD